MGKFTRKVQKNQANTVKKIDKDFKPEIFYADCDLEFVTTAISDICKTGASKTAAVLYLVAWCKKKTEDELREAGREDGFQYAVSWGMDKSVSGLAEIIYLEGVLGEKGLVGYEFDAPTFVKAGVDMKDLYNAVVVLHNQRVEFKKTA